MFFLSDTMKFLIVFALAFAKVSAKDLYSGLIEVPVLQNEGRITNGEIAAEGQFKYQVGICLKTGSNADWCGGSLISKDCILTAAHCTVGVSSAKVFLGATKRLVAEKVYNAAKSDIIIHPDFNSSTFKCDISLIRIPTTSESSRIGIVRIPSNNDNKYHGDSVVVAGWGYINDDTKALSNNLQYAILKVSPGSVCSKDYDDYNDAIFVCVATPNRVSTCEGDSGSPLVLEGTSLQIGLASYINNDGCAKGSPVVFIRVAPYRFWLKSYTKITY